MEKKKLGGLLLALWLAVLPLYGAMCFADTADDKRAELNDVRQRMERMQTRKEQARRKAESASAELSEVMGSLNELQAQANNLQKKSDALQGKINDNQAKLEKKQQEMQERMLIYRKRLRDIYINGQINYLDVLLGAKDFSDFSSRMYLLQKIISRDLELLEKLKQDAAEINSRKEQLAAEMKEIKATQTELEAKKAKVNKLREQRAYMLYKAQEEEQSSQEEYERLLAISENIASMLRNMENSGGGAPAGQGGTGQFMWPCNGPITSYYGWRTHPIFGTTKYHSGMDIAVD